MRVELEGIKFNYDPDDLKKTGAFNLRFNETQKVRVPEWQSDICSEHQCSPVAYAIEGLPKEMTIEASFRSDKGLETPLMIKACAEPPGHILGDIEAREINHPGSSGFVKFNLPHARVSKAGIGFHDIAWRWQYSDTPNIWKDFQTTFHRVYTVIARPTKPWEPESSDSTNIHQPWTEVLDYACCWARRVKSDRDEAAKLITRNFFDLGQHLLKYKSGGFYAAETFDCTKFLALLRNGIGGGQLVNCDDCATVVSTFANILGCELWQSGIGEYFFTNPVLLIGADDFAKTEFIYHSVAWKGDCKEDDELFDGCLQIDENVEQPFIPMEAADLPFGAAGTDRGYRFSLIPGRPDVGPLPCHQNYGKRRRPLGSGYLGQLRVTENGIISELKRRFEFEGWPKEPDPDEINSNIRTEELFLPGWALYSSERFNDERFPNVIQLLFTSADMSKDKLLAINVYENNIAADSNPNLLELLGRFEELRFSPLKEPRIGDIAFADKDETVVLFRRGRRLIVVRNAGRQQFSVIQLAQTLDKRLR
jgi:hypothetical protein